MARKSELVELRERIVALELRLAPKPQAPAEPTTAETMQRLYGIETDPAGKIIATPEQIVAYDEAERRKDEAADERMAHAAFWNETNRSSIGAISSPLSPNAKRILEKLKEAAAREPAVEMFGPHVITPELRTVLDGKKAEHHAHLVVEGLASDTPDEGDADQGDD